MKFKCTITEVLRREIEIEAENEQEAQAKLKEMYGNEEIVLDSSDFIDKNLRIENI